MRAIEKKSDVHRLWLVSAFVVWTAVIVGSLLWGFHHESQDTLMLATKEANAYFNKNKTIRLWAASHGGVYVPVDQHTPPNPRLSHVPERDIQTPSGKLLTLMNPAYLLTQMMNDYSDLYGAKEKITSFPDKLMNLENMPDQWELESLNAFKQGAAESRTVVDVDGEPFLRLMKPFFVKKDCMKCHAFQGYKVGDLRGGLSISVSMESYLKSEREARLSYIGTLGLLWLGGLMIFLYAYRLVKHREQARKDVESAMRIQSEIAQNIDEGIYLIQSVDNTFVYTNEKLEQMYGYGRRELIGKHLSVVHASDGSSQEEVTEAVSEELLSQGSWQGELLNIRKDGSIFWVYSHISCFEHSDYGHVCLGVQRDISERKKMEEELHDMNKKLKKLSFQDGLTDISNRRMLDLMLYKEWGRGMREKHPLSLIMIDIDYFKQYNDKYGHLQGDECLKSIAHTLSVITKRSPDLCARYGGEEFVILLPNTELKDATILAEMCREQVAALHIPHESSDVCGVVSISAGVATMLPVDGLAPASLIEAADVVLYRAKSGGRNRVESKEQEI